jgi:hypothetical protein
MGRMFGTMRRGTKGGRRKVPNEELCNLNASPDVIVAVKSRKMRRARSNEKCMENFIGKFDRKRALRRAELS